MAALVGAVPHAGEPRHIVWKASGRSLRLLEVHLDRPRRERRSSLLGRAAVQAARPGAVADRAWLAWLLLTALAA